MYKEFQLTFHLLSSITISITGPIANLLEFLEGKTAVGGSSGDDMDVDSDEQKDPKEEVPLLPPEAFIHNRADKLTEDGGASPAGTILVSEGLSGKILPLFVCPFNFYLKYSTIIQFLVENSICEKNAIFGYAHYFHRFSLSFLQQQMLWQRTFDIKYFAILWKKKSVPRSETIADTTCS